MKSAVTNLDNQTVGEIATNNGLSPSDITATYRGSLTRGATITATVTVTIPLTVFPGIATFGSTQFKASSTQQVDRYRPVSQSTGGAG